MDWDVDLFYWINGFVGRSAITDQMMLEVGHASYLWFPGLLAFAYWLWTNRREALIGGTTLAGLIVIADFFGAQLKHAFARPRPCQALQHINEIAGCGGTFSFPSNHAVNTATAAAFLYTLYPRTGWVTGPIVLAVGFSRVYLGGHYVSDVLGGWVLGGVLGAGAGLLLLRWSKFRPSGRGSPSLKPEEQSLS